jgi:uncharacterized protein with HEPN domain
MNNRDYQISQKILLEIRVIDQLVEGFDIDNFLEDEGTKRAVCMTLINISELAKNLSEDFKALYNDIPWSAISGIREVMIHKYQAIKMGDVWITIEEDIPSFRNKLKKSIQNEYFKSLANKRK